MLKNVIEEFKGKHTNFNFEGFINDYLKGASREALCSQWNVTELPLRMFMKNLGLEWVKSKRHSSFEGFKYRLGLEDNISDVKLVKELEKDVEILSEKNRKLYHSLTLIRDENTALRKESRQEVRQENLYDSLIEGVMNGISTINLPTNPFILVDRSILNTKEAQPFVLLSDLHYNEVIEGKYIEDYNEFNNQICLDGIDKLLTKVQKYEGDTLRLYLAGDLVSGVIHFLDLKGQIPVTSSIIELAYFLADRINKLATQYRHIKVMMVNGNHSRLGLKPTLDLKAFDFEHLLYELMKVQITQKNVNLEYSYSTYLIDNIGTEDSPKYVGLFHGDNKSFNPTSEAGVLKQFGIFDELFGVRVHSLMSGHTHKALFATSPRGGSILVNGCASGSNQFGFNANFLPLQPYQWIGTWSKEGYVEDMECVRLR